MKKICYAISVPLIAVTLGFVSPEIDINHNIRDKVIQRKKGTKDKSDKLESFRTRRDFRNRIRERFNERYGDQRRIAQFYVNSWFVASFSLGLDDNTLLRTKDVYGKAISEVGLITKGNNRRNKENSESLKKIYSTFDYELKRTLNVEQYKKLKEMTRVKDRNIKVDKGDA